MDAFAQTYFSNRSLAHKRTHATLQGSLQPALQRYQAADEDNAIAFRDKLDAFYRLYGFLSQIIPYGDSQLEKLALFRTFPSFRTSEPTAGQNPSTLPTTLTSNPTDWSASGMGQSP